MWRNGGVFDLGSKGYGFKSHHSEKQKKFRGVGGMVRRVCFENKYNCEVIVGSSPTLPI